MRTPAVAAALLLFTLAGAGAARAQGQAGVSPWWIMSQAEATNSITINPYFIRNTNGVGFFDMSGTAQRYWVQRPLNPVGTGHELWNYSTGEMWVGDLPTNLHGNRITDGGLAEHFHAPQCGGYMTAPGEAYFGGISAANAEFQAGARLMGRESWVHLNHVFYSDPVAFQTGNFYMRDGRLLQELANGSVVERELGALSALGRGGNVAEAGLGSRALALGGRGLNVLGTAANILTIESTAAQLLVGPTERNVVIIANQDQARLGNDAFTNPLVQGYVMSGASTDNLPLGLLPAGNWQQRIPNREMYILYATFGPDWVREGGVDRMIRYYREHPNAPHSGQAEDLLWRAAQQCSANTRTFVDPSYAGTARNPARAAGVGCSIASRARETWLAWLVGLAAIVLIVRTVRRSRA